MSIEILDLAELAVVLVLFGVLYYLDRKKHVDYGLLILAGTAFGIICGLIFKNHYTYVEIFGSIYTNVLTAFVIPLLLFSIISSITNLTESARLKNIGAKTIFFLLLNTFIASIITVAVCVFLRIGSGFQYELTNDYTAKEVPSVASTIISLFPSNFALNWSQGNLIPVIIFALIIAISYNYIITQTEDARPFKTFIDAGSKVIGTSIDYIIGFTPYAVLSFMARAVGRSDLSSLLPLIGILVLAYALCFIQAYGVEAVLIALVARLSPIRFFRGIAPAQYVAFTTQSSVGTIPVTTKRLTGALGVDADVAAFTAGLGANVGMPACSGIWPSMIAIFSVNLLGYEYSITQYIFLILVTLVVSIGTVGVPGTSTITTTAVFAAMGLPIEIIVIFSPISSIVDMARTLTNVTGAATAAVLTARTEGMLNEEVYNKEEKAPAANPAVISAAR